MIELFEFGIRSVPPCEDCWENGQCSMNCGPAAPAELFISQWLIDKKEIMR